MGELLREMMQKGERAAQHNGRPSKASRGATHTLDDLGLNRHEASRAMQLAGTGPPCDNSSMKLCQKCAATAVAGVMFCNHSPPEQFSTQVAVVGTEVPHSFEIAHMEPAGAIHEPVQTAITTTGAMSGMGVASSVCFGNLTNASA